MQLLGLASRIVVIFPEPKLALICSSKLHDSLCAHVGGLCIADLKNCE